MTRPAVKEKSAPTAEPVTVTVTPVKDAGAGVYNVWVKVDNRKPGSSVVRTSPREVPLSSSHQTGPKNPCPPSITRNRRRRPAR